MTMTVWDVYELQRKGLLEEAYCAVRELYAVNKDRNTSLAMFWIAVDILAKRLHDHQYAEAQLILKALERMLPRVENEDERTRGAFDQCKAKVDEATNRKTSQTEKPDHLKMGIWGEELVVAYLREKGYVIMERDWHSGHRDIDIIARKDDFVVFVEVKTRRNTFFTAPEAAVNYQKQRNLRRAINHYVKYRHIDSRFQFDIITVVGQPGDEHPDIQHLEDVDITRA